MFKNIRRYVHINIYKRHNHDMPSYQYRDSHYRKSSVSRPSYFYKRNIYTWKYGYIDTGLGLLGQAAFTP